MHNLQSKIDYSVELLRRAESLALKMHPDGFHLAFSGGKDYESLFEFRHREDFWLRLRGFFAQLTQTWWTPRQGSWVEKAPAGDGKTDCCGVQTSSKTKQMDRVRYPGVERAIKRSIQVLIDTVQYGSRYNLNADQIFDWYISGKSLADYAATLRQGEIEFGE